MGKEFDKFWDVVGSAHPLKMDQEAEKYLTKLKAKYISLVFAAMMASYAAGVLAGRFW